MIHAQIPKDKTQIKHEEKKQVEMKPENLECYKLKSGKFYQTIDGKEVVIKKDITLKNGSIVHKDGKVTDKKGLSVQLKEGECIDINGMIKKESKKMK